MPKPRPGGLFFERLDKLACTRAWAYTVALINANIKLTRAL